MRCALKVLGLAAIIVGGLYALAVGEAVALTILAERQSEAVAGNAQGGQP